MWVARSWLVIYRYLYILWSLINSHGAWLFFLEWCSLVLVVGFSLSHHCDPSVCHCLTYAVSIEPPSYVYCGRSWWLNNPLFPNRAKRSLSSYMSCMSNKKLNKVRLIHMIPYNHILGCVHSSSFVMVALHI